MINLARQAFANPFAFATGFQPGLSSSVGRCPSCGSIVGVGTQTQHQNAGLNPVSLGAIVGQQTGGFAGSPYATPQTTGFGQVNPFANQYQTGVPQGFSPFAAQFGTNWPVSSHLPNQGVGARAGAFGIDPRLAIDPVGQQFGNIDPNVVQGLINANFTTDPVASLLSQQINPLAQQQLPIRPLIAGQQGLGSQSFIPGFTSPVMQWADAYKAFIEAQLIAQLAANPLHQLQRVYGGVPELSGMGVPPGAGQQFNPLLTNIPFYG